MYNKIAEVDRYVRSNDYYPIDETLSLIHIFLCKNETHNHPTEIEPFGGAATCIGGCIRDPLSVGWLWVRCV